MIQENGNKIFMNQNLKYLEKGEADNYFKRNKEKILKRNNNGQNHIVDSFKISGISPKSILEIGCFNGYKLDLYRKFYLKNKKKVKCFGVDLSKQAIEDGNKKYTKLNLFQLSSMKINKLKNKFDLIICDFLYLLDRELLFEQFDLIYKCLNKDGHILISEFDPIFPHFNVNNNKKNFFSYKVDYSDFLTSSHLFKKIYSKKWTDKKNKSKYLDNDYSITLYKKINFNLSFPKNIFFN